MIALSLLARPPLPGQVKTRLIPALGAQGAMEAHQILVAHVWTILTAFARQHPCRLTLWAQSNPHHPFFTALAPPHPVRPQPPGDLGEKLLAIARQELAEDATGVILTGGDAVDVTTTDLAAAIRGLEEGYEGVMKPARDGGYLLLALPWARETCFRAIPWGTAEVAAVTRGRFPPGTLLELPVGEDVDGPEAWRRFLATYPIPDTSAAASPV